MQMPKKKIQMPQQMKSKEKPNPRGWHVPKVWDSSEPVFIFGGGPSIKGVDFSGLAKYRSIGVNSSFKIGHIDRPYEDNWIDICFFGDFGWWDRIGREATRLFPGTVITCSPTKVFHIIPRVSQVNRSKPVGIETKTNYIAWNRNSGFAAINIAYHLGARTIVLLGFDMKMNGNTKNWHDDYNTDKGFSKKAKGLYGRWLAAVPAIQRDAEKLGLTILNGTPDSAILQWDKVDWRDYLDPSDGEDRSGDLHRSRGSD